MAKQKYCETLKPGFYYIKGEGVNIGIHRCFYLTGTTKGNKWIELVVKNPQWTSLMWNTVSSCSYEIELSQYYEENPTDHQLIIKK
jgi:hypothetical protein